MTSAAKRILDQALALPEADQGAALELAAERPALGAPVVEAGERLALPEARACIVGVFQPSLGASS